MRNPKSANRRLLQGNDTEIWLNMAQAIYEHDSNIEKLFAAYDFDAVKILNEFTEGRYPECFPEYHKERKIVLWMVRLERFAKFTIKNLDKMPMPIGMHIIRATFMSGAVTGETTSIDMDIRARLSEYWHEVADTGKEVFNLSPTELAGLQRQDQIAKALKRIYYLLSLKDYTLGELQTKLKQKSFTSDIINESLQLIQSQGLIDEKNIAQGILDKYTACKPEGWRRIKARLNTKGIDKEIVSEIVDQAKQRNEFDLAWKIGKKKYAKLLKQSKPRVEHSLYNYLIRKGFDIDTVNRVVNKLTDDELNGNLE